MATWLMGLLSLLATVAVLVYLYQAFFTRRSGRRADKADLRTRRLLHSYEADAGLEEPADPAELELDAKLHGTLHQARSGDRIDSGGADEPSTGMWLPDLDWAPPGSDDEDRSAG